MKKLLISLLVLLVSGIVAKAEQEPGTERMWKDLDLVEMRLVAYGDWKKGKELNRSTPEFGETEYFKYHGNKSKNDREGTLFWRTLDKNENTYKAKLRKNIMQLDGKVDVDASGNNDRSYRNSLKMEWFEIDEARNVTVFITDSFGMYRIFKGTLRR